MSTAGVLDPEAAKRLELTWRWLHDFPVNPHPDLGRTGPVCPYMGRALEYQLVDLMPFDARQGVDAFEARARVLQDEFEAATKGSEHPIYLVSFLVPYGLPDAELRTVVEQVHNRVRPDFVQRGMMAGDFWPHHESHGLHSRAFRPFASPLPIFAIRNMIPGDLPFFSGSHTPPQERLEYLGYYRKVFDGRLPEYWSDRLDHAEDQARAALATIG